MFPVFPVQITIILQAFNATEEIEDAVHYPAVRVFTAAEQTSATPLIDLKSVQEKWSVPSKG